MLFFHVCNAFIIADWLSGERYWLWAAAPTGTKEREMEDMSCYRQVICMCLKEHVYSLPCKVLFILWMLYCGLCIDWIRAVLLLSLKLSGRYFLQQDLACTVKWCAWCMYQHDLWMLEKYIHRTSSGRRKESDLFISIWLEYLKEATNLENNHTTHAILVRISHSIYCNNSDFNDA